MLLLSALCGIALPAVAAERPVTAFVDAIEHGQAQLLNRLGECYAVTPAHVMGNDWYAKLVGQGGGNAQGEGDLLQTFGYDLAILRVSGGITRKCGGSLGRIASLDNLLAGASTGSIRSINADGSVTRRNVTLNDTSLLYIQVRPRTPQDDLFQGLSGSLLEVGGQAAGILMSVDASSGEGKVLRYDRAIETLRPFFGVSTASRPPARAELPLANEKKPSVRPTIASWSSPALNANTRATNLIDGDITTSWYAVADKFPVDLVLEAPEQRAMTVNRVRLIGSGVEPRQRLLKDFELLIDSGDRGNWVPVGSGTYIIRDDSKQIFFAPQRARRVMLRIYSHWGDADAVGLSDIEIRGDE